MSNRLLRRDAPGFRIFKPRGEHGHSATTVGSKRSIGCSRRARRIKGDAAQRSQRLRRLLGCDTPLATALPERTSAWHAGNNFLARSPRNHHGCRTERGDVPGESGVRHELAQLRRLPDQLDAGCRFAGARTSRGRRLGQGVPAWARHNGFSPRPGATVAAYWGLWTRMREFSYVDRLNRKPIDRSNRLP
jgi:hypothetical protein